MHGHVKPEGDVTDRSENDRTRRAEHRPHGQPSGGWGSVGSLVRNATRQQAVSSVLSLVRDHNKTGGYMCASCAWAKPAEPHLAEFCENGAKATFWDLTSKRTTPEFFARHRVSELLEWSDHELEDEGRLAHPMRYEASSDTYVPVSWEDAFTDIGKTLRSCKADDVVFYASGIPLWQHDVESKTPAAKSVPVRIAPE